MFYVNSFFIALTGCLAISKDLVVIDQCYVEINGFRQLSLPLNVRGCQDKSPEYCDALFGNISLPEDATKGSCKVSGRCYHPTFMLDAKERCARTCALCCKLPQYDCTDVDEHHCKMVKDYKLCDEPGYIENAIKICPSSCGLCDQPGAGGIKCKDIFDNCEGLKTFLSCDEPVMKEKCKHSCGIQECGKETIQPERRKNAIQQRREECKDTRTGCENYKVFCNHAKMRQYCKATCGVC